MNTYGRTACPKCGCLNSMYRGLSDIKKMPAWDDVECFFCNHQYKHTDKINNVETEAEKVKREGNF